MIADAETPPTKIDTQLLVDIWWALLVPARASAARLGPAYLKEFTTSAVVLSVLWLLYPIAWGVADGGNVITPTSEMVRLSKSTLF